MAAPIMTFNGAQVRVNAGECDGSETVHEIRTEADAERLYGKGSTAYGLAMMGLRSHTEIRALFGEADASGPDRTGRVLAELTREGTTRPPEMRDPDPRIQKWVDAAERVAARPTLRIYDADGCVLAEGPAHADKARGGKARLHYRIQVATTGTAERWTVSAPGFEAGGDIEDLNIGMRALGSGHYIVGTLDVMAFGLDVSERNQSGQRCPGCLAPPDALGCSACDGSRLRACAGCGAPEAKGSAMLKTPTCEECATAIRPPTPGDERAAREAPDAKPSSLIGNVTKTADGVTLWLPDGVRVSRPVRDDETAEKAAERLLEEVADYVTQAIGAER